MADSAQCTVYVVDDNDLLLDVLTQTLESLDCTAVPFDSAQAFRERVSNDDTPFDILLTDQIMPGEEGADLAQWVKQQYPDVGVIVMSGQINEELEQKVEGLEACLLLRKPAMRAEIRDALNRVQALRGVAVSV